MQLFSLACTRAAPFDGGYLGKDTVLGMVRLSSVLGAETRAGSHHGDPRAL